MPQRMGSSRKQKKFSYKLYGTMNKMNLTIGFYLKHSESGIFHVFDTYLINLDQINSLG